MNPTTDRTNVTSSGYTYGGKDYVHETRYDTNNTPYQVDLLKGSSPAINTKPSVSTTTISNQNKIQQVPQMVSKVNELSQGRGLTTDGTTTRYADGTIYNDNYSDPVVPQGASPIYGSVNGIGNRVVGYNMPNFATGALTSTYFDSGTSTPKQTKEDAQIDELMASMKAQTDAITASKIASIQQKFSTLREQQRQINEAQKGAINTALLTGGVTGKGSTAQYAPISSEGIVASQLNYGLQQIAQLDAQETDLINAAKEAQMSQDFKLLDRKLAEVEKIRAEKAKSTEELNKKLAEQNQKAREKMIQATRDNALSDLYSQGITDPTQLLEALNKNSGDFTLKEINEGLQNLVPEGLDDLVKTLRQNGAPQDVIQKVLSSPNINEAYKNAGMFGAGGTGIIGEYNFYRAQAQAQGVNPVDFNTYQNMDANRKAKVASAGVVTAGAPTSYKEWELAGKPGTYAEWIKEQNIKAPTVAQQTVAEYAARIEQAEPTIESLQKTIQGMDYFTFTAQINLPAVAQSSNIQQYMQAARNFINAKLRRESGAVISPTEFSEARKQYLPQPGDSPEVLSQKKDNRDLVMASLKKAAGPAYESVEELIGSSQKLVQAEKEAQSTLQVYLKNNPGKQQEVSNHIKVMEKQLGRPITTIEFYEAFPEYKD